MDLSVSDFWRAQNGVRHITPRGLQWPEGEWIQTAFDDLRGMKVLEFGCGPGRLAQFFDPSDYVGVDINERAVVEARARNEAHTFRVVDDAERLGPVDVILCHTVLLHVPDDALQATIDRFDARRVRVNELLGRGWRRDGDPPVFNRDLPEYDTAFSQAGFVTAARLRMTYEHYREPMTLLDYERR